MCNDFINRYGELTKYVAVVLQHLLSYFKGEILFTMTFFNRNF